MNDERLSGALQENILTLLCFNDAACKIARAAVTPQLFESSVFREVAGHAIDFIDQYGEAIKDHLPDHLEGILNGDDQRKATTYKRLLDNLFSNRDSINPDYVVSQLHKFVRLQTFKSGLVKAVEAVEDGRIDEAEVEMQKAMKTQVSAFSAGLNMSDPNQVAQLFDNLDEPGFDLGITHFDQLGIIPRRKQLTMFLAPRGRGKSWFCVHAAKMALVQRWTVVIVTLEMSQNRYGARLLQSFFSISERESMTRVARLVHGRDGSLQDIIQEQIERMTLHDQHIRTTITSRVKREFRKRPPLVIKEFPTQGLDMAGLRAYLDALERHEHITPDLLIVDYPDLMKHDSNNKRVELGLLVEQLRGVAVERNCAVVAPTQSNAAGEKATTVQTSDVAEDLSKMATADTVYTYSQTPAEKKLGLARLLAGKDRNHKDGASVLITQGYGFGQFCLDSTVLHSDYWGVLEQQGAPRRTRHAAE